MFTLFWRLFLGFWISLLLIGFAGTWLSESLRDDEKALRLNPAQYLFLKKFRKRVKQRSVKNLIKYWQRNPPRKPIKNILIVDANGQSIDNKNIPEAVKLLLIQSDGRPMLIRNWSELWMGPLSISSRGENYQFFIQTENVPGLNSRHWLEHPLARILLLLFASLAAAFLVSLFLVRPIKKLQLAVQALGSDLSVRVDPKITQRRDELGKLGQKINHMAETIQTLVNSQQHILWDVSHELRSPLARMQTALAIAEQKSEPEKAISRLNKEVDLLNQMITQLLLLGRLESGLQKLQHEPVHLKNLINQIIDDMRYENKQPFSISVNIEGEHQVTGDPLLLASVFGNVLRNAREHNHQNVNIIVEAVCKNKVCTISIRDDGAGISRVMEQQLFTPFKRDSMNTRGLGLGMAITKNIINLHNGKIQARNLPKGFEVVITLPIEKED